MEAESAKNIFEERLSALGVEFQIDGNGCYSIEADKNSITANIENIAREYARDGDPDSVRRFADQIVDRVTYQTPSWELVQPYIRFQLEPDDYADGFDIILHHCVGDGLVKVFVYVSEDGRRITWISAELLRVWDATPDQVVSLAEQNMRKIVSEANIEILDGNGITLGMIATQESPFKASLLLADNFRELVEPNLGFPLYAVAPCRDFVFLVPHTDRNALGRLGDVVMEQFKNSGYSVTMDVLEITKDGLSSIGRFAPKNSPDQGSSAAGSDPK